MARLTCLAISVLLLMGSRAGSATPLEEHLKQLGVDRLHEKGIKGRGMTIAVLDTGFLGYEKQLGSLLPEQVVAKSFRVDRNLEAKSSLHGLTCAEIVHTVAPGARVLLANWEPDSPRHFLEAVRWAKGQGANVISCSVVMPGWSDGRGGGEVHRRLKEILGDVDDPRTPLFFAAVGNFAERHLSPSFRDDGTGFHRWPTSSNELRLTPWGSGPICVELTHSQRVDYRLEVLDGAGRKIGSRFGAVAEGMRGHSVRFFPDAMEDYAIRIEKVKGPSEEPFRMIVLGASLPCSESRGSVAFPGDGDEVIGVGAIDERLQRVSYSGCGFENNKPDCVATVPFPARAQPAFGGTSAAAPQAAALAVLLWSAEPRATPRRIRERLFNACEDVGPPGADRETGRGLIGIRK